MTTEKPSYIDYDIFLSPEFSPYSFANSLILATNDPTDTTLDLPTPLSRVLFDIQEIDVHIDNLTTKSALTLLDYTRDRSDASANILDQLTTQLEALNEGYDRLRKDVIERYERAEKTRLAAERLNQTLRLGRIVSRCIGLGKQLETQASQLGFAAAGGIGTAIMSNNGRGIGDAHSSMILASETLLELQSVFTETSKTPQQEQLERVQVITNLRTNVSIPVEKALVSLAQSMIRDFSITSVISPSTSSPLPSSQLQQTTTTRPQLSSAFRTLYLLSSYDPSRRNAPLSPSPPHPVPQLLLAALTQYLQTNINSSLTSLARALATLPTLDRTLREVSARCRNIVALGEVLNDTKRGVHPVVMFGRATIKPSQPSHPDDQSSDSETDCDSTPHSVKSQHISCRKETIASIVEEDDSQLPFLPLLLSHLDTSSLASYFWRTMASNMTSRVSEIINRGGVSARTLKTNKDRVATAVRECVLSSSSSNTVVNGSGEGIQPSAGSSNEFTTTGDSLGNIKVEKQSWDREAAVMVGSIIGALGR